MTQHTKGPWKCEGFENLVVNDEEGNTITCAPGGRYGATLGELKANARLIAAAPELLEALKQIAALYDSAASSDGEIFLDESEIGQIAKAALAKAQAEGGI